MKSAIYMTSRGQNVCSGIHDNVLVLLLPFDHHQSPTLAPCARTEQRTKQLCQNESEPERINIERLLDPEQQKHVKMLISAWLHSRPGARTEIDLETENAKHHLQLNK